MEPNLIVAFSGKRKSGKDYSCQKLTEMLLKRERSLLDKPCLSVGFITLAAILKETYAFEHKLDYEKMLDSSEYKELHRLGLIKYSTYRLILSPSFKIRDQF